MRRLLCLVAAIGLAWVAGQDAALAYWRSSVARDSGSGAPVSVPAFLSGNAAIRLQSSDGLRADPAALASQQQQIGEAARAVLRRTPLDVLAMRQLGMIAELGNPGAGRIAIALAERITRRDLPTEVLSIGLAGRAADTLAPIRHYHHALAVFPPTYPELLPSLASRMSNQQVRQALAGYIGQSWLRELVINPVSYDAPPAAMMDFYAENTSRLATRDMQLGTASLVRWLYAYGQYAVLADYAKRLPGVNPKDMSEIGFNAVTSDPVLAPLSWSLINDASVESVSDGNGMQLRIEPGISAIAATRVTLLAPGQYDFAQTLDFPADTARAHLEWIVECPKARPGQLLALAPVPETAGSGFVQRGQLTIPADCEAQTWQLRASADDHQAASAVRVFNLLLARH